jgi:protein-tyrosine phosphatase
VSAGGWTDLHAHVVPAVDDGPDDLAGSLALLRALAHEGVGRVCATPHVQPYPYPTTAEDRDAGLAGVLEAVRAEGIEIEVLSGGEVDLEYAGTWNDDELGRFTLGGGRALLVEFPWVGGFPLALAHIVRDLTSRGFLPVIAHPERAPVVQSNPDRLNEALADGAVCQITAGAVIGGFGRSARDAALELLRSGRGHLLASDAHNAGGRGPVLREAHAALVAACGADFADALLTDAPEAVLAGRVPSLPTPERPRRRLFRR